MSELIEIDEEGEIDVEAIMQQIRAHLMARKMAANGDLRATPDWFDGRLAPELYEALYNVTMTYDRIAAPKMLTETSIPVVGRLWMAVRAQFHNLVLFYANKIAAKQVVFNRHLVALVSEMVKELEALPTAGQVTDLHGEIETLRRESLGHGRDEEGG